MSDREKLREQMRQFARATGLGELDDVQADVMLADLAKIAPRAMAGVELAGLGGIVFDCHREWTRRR